MRNKRLSSARMSAEEVEERFTSIVDEDDRNVDDVLAMVLSIAGGDSYTGGNDESDEEDSDDEYEDD